MTSMPSTSHCGDSARSRWICSRRCSSADSGSSSSSTLASGLASLKLSTTVLNAPVVDNFNEANPDANVELLELPESADEQRRLQIQRLRAESPQCDVPVSYTHLRAH